MLSWTTGVPDWEVRIVAGQSLIPAVPLDEARAAKALRVFKRLKLVDVPGQPTMGEACEEWVFEFVRVIFGARNPETKRQIIREFFLLISKKNGKSSIAAGIMLTALILNERSTGEYLILAPTKDVADNSFTPAYGMVKADPALLRRFKPSDSTREIVDRVNDSVLAVKSADADVVGGQKAIAVFVDELWLFGKKASAENILSEATGSLVSRPEGFVIYASTQSDEPPAGVFKKKLDYYRDIRDGKLVDRASLPLIYEYPAPMLKAEAWRNRETWRIPNPSLERSVDPAWLTSKLIEKERDGPKSLQLFLAKHFNVEPGIGLRSDGWAGAPLWHRGIDKTITLDALIERCEVITGGIDGGGLDDLLGLAFIGREKGTKRWLGWAKAFISPEGLERRKANRSVYDDFERAGDLVYVEKLPDDVTALVDLVSKVLGSGLLDKMGVDSAGLGIIVDALAEIGVTVEGDENLVGVRQGFALMGPIKSIERKVADGSFKHAGQPLMAWCAGNAVVQPTATGMRIVRDASGFGKIDPLMALFDAAALMAMNPEAPRSVYEERGLRFV